jgi:hypothetical protein
MIASHGAAGREARYINSRRINSELRHDCARNARDYARFALIALLVPEIEPVPACQLIGVRRLNRIDDDQAMLLSQSVHARPRCEVVGILGAAVEHDNQRKRPASRIARDIDFVVPRTGFAGEGSGEISCPIRH